MVAGHVTPRQHGHIAAVGPLTNIALALAAHGCDVAIMSRLAEHLETPAGEIRARGRRSPGHIDGGLGGAVGAAARVPAAACVARPPSTRAPDSPAGALLATPAGPGAAADGAAADGASGALALLAAAAADADAVSLSFASLSLTSLTLTHASPSPSFKV